MALFKALCKWFGHSWKDNPAEWSRYDCTRCKLSKTYYYSQERGRYYEESTVS